MAILALQRGLVLRRGARTYEFLRQLDRNQVQFEDQLTRHVLTINVAKLFDALIKKDWEVVHEVDAVPAQPGTQLPAAPLLTDLSALPKKDKEDLLNKWGYIKALRRRGLTRGRRQAITAALPAIAAQLKDAEPPAASTVMGWFRVFERYGCNPAALLSGNRRRRRSFRLHPLVEELIDTGLRRNYLKQAGLTLRSTFDLILVDRGRRGDQLFECGAAPAPVQAFRGRSRTLWRGLCTRTLSHHTGGS
jgi:putative transposase